MASDDLGETLMSEAIKNKKPNYYNSWKAAVHGKYPRVFFPPLSPKKRTILKRVCTLIEGDGTEPAKLMEWVAFNWPNMVSLTGNFCFKIEYPDIDLFLAHYAKLLNLYKAKVAIAPTVKKRTRIVLSDDI